jgi:hypothetical protein
MSQIQVKDRYQVVAVEYGDVILEARWRGAHYVNYYLNGEEFACAWQENQVLDADSLTEFVLSNLPYHLGLEVD